MSNAKHVLVVPEFPYAEATRRAGARLDRMSPSELRQTFVDAGIATADGKLRAPYDGNGGPDDFSMLEHQVDEAAEE